MGGFSTGYLYCRGKIGENSFQGKLLVFQGRSAVLRMLEDFGGFFLFFLLFFSFLSLLFFDFFAFFPSFSSILGGLFGIFLKGRLSVLRDL